MRGVISAVCAVGAAIALQGCGGGGPSPAPGPAPAPSGACKNPAIDLVTSSLTASTKLDVDVTVKGIKVTESGTSDGTTKIDMTAWNARIDETTTLTTDTGAMKVAMKIETKIIVDVEKKLLVEWVKATNATSGKVMEQNCSAITIAKMPAPALITMAWNAIKGKMQQAAKCGGNDGTYDTWNINFVHHKDDPLPIPVPNLPKVDLTVDMKIQMDANYLLHSESMTISMDSPDIEGSGPMTVKETSTTTVSQASATGPVAADLDYSSWGKCTAITPPGHEFLNDFRGFKKDGKGTTRNLIMLTLQTALDMQANEQKVVV